MQPIFMITLWLMFHMTDSSINFDLQIKKFQWATFIHHNFEMPFQVKMYP